MSYSGSASVVSRVFDAALSRESWPLALEAVAETVGAIGAAYIVRSKETTGVEWISLSGPRTIDGRPLAIVIVTDSDAQSVSASDLADCFG